MSPSIENDHSYERGASAMSKVILKTEENTEQRVLKNSPFASLPLISVVIPCFNQGCYINETVQSVLNSTYPNYEIIIVNDGSTDEETNHILGSFTAPNTTIISTLNQGPSAARNTAIKAAKGEFILPLDADDKIAPTYIEKAIRRFEIDPMTALVYCEAEFFGSESGKWMLPPFSMKNFINGNCVFVSSVFRKADWEIVGGFNENMSISLEDWDFFISLIEKNANVYQIPETLFFYRKQAFSRTAFAKGKSHTSNQQIILNHLDFFLKNAPLMKLGLLRDFFSKQVRSHIKQRNLFYYKALFRYRLYQTSITIKSYLLFPIYIKRIYDMLRNEQK